MTPALEAALAPLNWNFVKAVAPFGGAFYEARLTPTGGLFAPRSADAAALMKRHARLMGGALDVLEELSAMPDDIAQFINVTVCPPDERDTGIPDRIANARAALDALVEGLVAAHEVLAWEGKPTRGGQTNKGAYRVAEAVAEIYVIGTGLKPTAGRRENGRGASGAFGQALTAVYGALDMRVGDVYRPCAKAVEALSEVRMRELLALRRGRRANASLFDVKPGE